MEYTNEFLQKVFNESKSQNEVIKKLGRKINGASIRLIKKLSDQIGIDLKQYGANLTRVTKEKYENAPKYCACCGKKLEFKQRNNLFCSNSCAATFNNTNRKQSEKTKQKISETLSKKKNKNFKYVPKKIYTNCLNCGKKLTNRNSKFCSSKCFSEYNYKERVKLFEDGHNFTKFNGQIPTFIKRYLMEKYDNKCEKCGWGEMHPITHNIPLEVHHIDGDCTNNKIENLQLLCPNCHSLTNNFGSLNKESKRFHRSKITQTIVVDGLNPS